MFSPTKKKAGTSAAGTAARPGAAPAEPLEPGTGGPRRVRLILLGVMLAMLLAMLDNVIVGTAMATIVSQLGGLNHLSWVVAAYTLTTAVSTPVWGKLGDLLSRKKVFLTSIVIFLAGSALSGAAQTMTQLIGFRALQGIGAGGLAVGAFAMIGALVPPRERGRYQSMTAMVMAIGTIGGPLLGGFITGHFGWRWAFYINVPLGVIAFAWCWVMLRLPKPAGKVKIDYAGAALLGAALTALVLVTTWGGTQYSWTSPQIIAAGLAGLVSLVAFLVWQVRAAEPILPLRLFRSRDLTLSSVMMVIVGAAMFGSVTFLPLYQQTVQGASATSSGLLLLPMVVPIIIVAQIMGRVIAKTGRYKVFPVLGGACLLAGSALLSTVTVTTSHLLTSVYMAVFGAGLGFLMQIGMLIAQNSVSLADMGVASGASTLFRTIGGSVGVTLFGALFSRQVDASMHASAGQLDAGDVSRLPAVARHAYEVGAASGIRSIFLWAAVLAAVCFAASWFLREVPLRGKSAAWPVPGTPAATVPASTAPTPAEGQA